MTITFYFITFLLYPFPSLFKILFENILKLKKNMFLDPDDKTCPWDRWIQILYNIFKIQNGRFNMALKMNKIYKYLKLIMIVSVFWCHWIQISCQIFKIKRDT